MKRALALFAVFVMVLHSAAFAVPSKELAGTTFSELFSQNGKLNWNCLDKVFREILENVDPAAWETPVPDAGILLPKVFPTILDCDTVIATFRKPAVSMKPEASQIWGKFVDSVARLRLLLNGLNGMIAKVPDPEAKTKLEAQARALCGKIIFLWLANMQFDPDSLAGPGFPPDSGDGISYIWEESDNQNYMIYQEAWDDVKAAVEEIARQLP